MSDLDKMRELAGIVAQPKEQIDEGIVGGFNEIPGTVVHRDEDDDWSKWMKASQGIFEDDTSESKPSQLNEHVVGDLQNGYDRQSQASANYGSDYFPTGEHYSVDDHAGPASGKQGDNPLQKVIKDNKKDDVIEESKAIHKELVYGYREFKAS